MLKLLFAGLTSVEPNKPAMAGHIRLGDETFREAQAGW